MLEIWSAVTPTICVIASFYIWKDASEHTSWLKAGTVTEKRAALQSYLNIPIAADCPDGVVEERWLDTISKLKLKRSISAGVGAFVFVTIVLPYLIAIIIEGF